MGACANCRTTILFGGTKYGGRTYCNARCANADAQRVVAQEAIPPAVLAMQIAEVHDGPCPKCKREVCVDMYPAHFVWSAVVLTRMTSRSALLCRSCARKRQAGHLVGSMLLGWWGFPFGLIFTPIQIVRNIVEMSKRENPNPSPELAAAVQSWLAQEVLAGGYLPEMARDADAPTKVGDAASGRTVGRDAHGTPVIDLVEPEKVERRR